MESKIQNYSDRQYMLREDFEVFYYKNRELKEVSLHHHDFYECYFFISGDVTYYIEGKIYNLKSGDIILINSEELHQASINDNSIDYERIVLWINSSFLKKLSSEKTDLTACFHHKNRKNLIRTDFTNQKDIRIILSKILNLQEAKGFGYELLYSAYITELMVYLNDYMTYDGKSLNLEIKKSSLISQVIEYINEHLEDEITLNQLAEYFYISKFHLSREFKKNTGTTIHRYIVQKKLIKAKECILLNIPINEVYKKCGFGDYSNFFRAFKNEYGVTPREYYEIMSKKI